MGYQWILLFGRARAFSWKLKLLGNGWTETELNDLPFPAS
ncbi:hypothetical protein BLEM_2199 [Bifidobacterium lemurum]|uniref:Uncharacterized protein n=1 Tax=Bifidobacterium lemurum TaxID=1603886 RepID=A0A261FLI7_9BIFI|nr:hypothetical protein BLEM_2199 [Bifidobacterium lemurum]